MNTVFNLFVEETNPLDFLEEISNHNAWFFKRIDAQTVSLQISGSRSKFDLTLEWDENMSTLMLSSFVNTKIETKNASQLNDILAQINQEIIYGHFGTHPHSNSPVYRYAVMVEGLTSPLLIDRLTDCIENAITYCDQYFTTFQMVENGILNTKDLMQTAMMKTVGEA